MASISSLMGTGSSGSIYGSRNSNILSGLASGLDTESMIEGLVQSYQQKITGLNQDRTTLQWKQEAYQSISDKLVDFSRKYMSYTSSTNLLSSSFFTNAVLTTTGGQFANLVSASGKSSSSIVLNAVAQLATAARYTTSAAGLGSASIDGGRIKVTGDAVDLSKPINVSTLEGSLTLNYGNKEVTIDFGELEFFDQNGDGTGTVTADQLKDAIVKKLDEENIVTSSGDQVKASELIGVDVSGSGEITFTDKANAGNSVYISGAAGKLKDTLRLDSVISGKGSSFTVAAGQTFSESVKTAEYLSGKTITVSLDGSSKTIDLSKVITGDSITNDEFKTNLQAALDNAFGAGKVQVGFDNSQLSFSVRSGSTLAVSSSVGEALGLGSGLTSYLDTNKTLGDLNGVTFDAEGNATLTINGVEIGTYTKDTALETVLNAINSNTEAGVNVSYSKMTNQFVFTAKETGEGGRIEIGGGLGQQLFGTVDTGDADSYTAGQDAVFQATINGQTMNLTRSSNTFDLDGMSITLSGVFNNADRGTNADPIKSADVNDALFADGEDVTFTSKTDADTIVDAVKSMVEDYNAIVEEVKKAYSTMPLQQTNGSRYEPLTEEDRADMTESEIKAYEEKAKTGLLFGDNDLSSLYNALRSAVAPGGTDGSYLRSIGIKTSYSEGLTTIELDESALREALETDPDRVKDVFTKSREGGASTDGLMTSIQKVTDRYASTTGAVKGILIEKAGSQYSPTAALDNALLNQMEEIDEQISKWQTKMSDQVDYYTNKFTQLEMLIQQMNSQSSTLSGLMGGY